MVSIRNLVVVLLISGCFAGYSDAQPSAKINVPDNVTFTQNHVYCTPNGLTLKLDLAVPKGGKGPYPTILIFNGIGPLSKGRAGLREYTLGLAQQGFAVVAVAYRHESNHAFPAAYQDASAALAWVMNHCDKHRLDKNRVGAMGFSGGGTLAMMLGTQQPDKVKAVVSFFSPSDMKVFHEKADGLAGLFLRPMLEEWLGGIPQTVPNPYRNASPITFAKKGSAPHLFIHGTADFIVPLEQSKIMADKLRGAGVKVNLLALEGAPHNLDETPGLYAQVAFLATELFFAEHLSRSPDNAVAIKPIVLSPLSRPKQ